MHLTEKTGSERVWIFGIPSSPHPQVWVALHSDVIVRKRKAVFKSLVWTFDAVK